MSEAITENRATLRAYDSVQDWMEVQEAAAALRDHARAQTRLTVEALNLIPAWAFTESTCAHLIAVLSARIAASNWSHTEAAGIAQQALDDTSDYLADEGKKHG